MKVTKALSPEQRTALMNAKALISEIEGMDAGEGQEDDELKEAYMALNEKEQMGDQPEGEDVEKEDGEDEKEPDGDEAPMKVKKNTTTIGPEDKGTATASDDAEERVDTTTEQGEKNLDEIAKSLATLVKEIGKKNVTKSSKPNQIETVIIGLAKVVKSMQTKQDQQNAVLCDILDGLGLAKTVEQNYNNQVQKSQSRRPVQTSDTNEVLKEVAVGLKALVAKQSGEQDAGGNSGFVRKSLADNLNEIFRQ